MLFLNPKKYDLLEKKAIKLLPIPVLMAFKPKVFSDHGYPVKITSKLELTKFVDHNFEPLIDNIFKLEPGHTLLVTHDGKRYNNKYYDLNQISLENHDEKDILDNWIFFLF